MISPQNLDLRGKDFQPKKNTWLYKWSSDLRPDETLMQWVWVCFLWIHVVAELLKKILGLQEDLGIWSWRRRMQDWWVDCRNRVFGAWRILGLQEWRDFELKRTRGLGFGNLRMTTLHLQGGKDSWAHASGSFWESVLCVGGWKSESCCWDGWFNRSNSCRCCNFVELRVVSESNRIWFLST